MSDYSNLFEMLGNSGFGNDMGSCPPPPGPGPCPPPPGPGPCPPPVGPGFGGNGILLWLIILFFFGFGRGGCGFGVGNNSGCNNNCGNSCGNNCGNSCGCGSMMCGYDTGCCTTMMPNPCDYTEYCNCCGKRVKKCKKQKNYIVEMCQCGGNLPAGNDNCGCGNTGFGNGGFGCGNGNGFWWIIILIILFCFRGGNGLLGGAPGVPFAPQRPGSCGC